MKRGEIAQSVSRGAFFLAIEKAAALLSGVIYVALITRWLGPTKYGTFSIALSVIGIATLATGNFEEYLQRYAAEYQARGDLGTLRRAFRMALGFKLALGALAAVVLVALAPWVSTFYQSPDQQILLPLLVLIVATDGFATVGRGTLFGLQHFDKVSIISLGFHVAKTVMVGLLWKLHQGLPQMALATALLTAMQALAMWITSAVILARSSAPPGEPAAMPGAPAAATSRGLLRGMLAYCLPLLGARATFLSGQNLGTLVLGKVLDATQLGYFRFAFQTVERFVELLKTVPDALLPSLTHLVTREERERLRQVFDQAFRLIQVIAFGLSFTIFAFAPELTLWVGSPLFAPAIPVLRVLALVPLARTAQQPLTMLFQALRRPALVLQLAFVKFATELGCYFLLVPSFGVMGAGWANLAGAVASYFGALLLLATVLPEGRVQRLSAAGRTLVLLIPGIALALAADLWIGGYAATFVRAALVVLAALGVFALRLVNRYDLGKLSSIPLGTAWLRRCRDTVVSGLDRLVRTFEPGSVS